MSEPEDAFDDQQVRSCVEQRDSSEIGQESHGGVPRGPERLGSFSISLGLDFTRTRCHPVTVCG